MTRAFYSYQTSNVLQFRVKPFMSVQHYGVIDMIDVAQEYRSVTGDAQKVQAAVDDHKGSGSQKTLYLRDGNWLFDTTVTGLSEIAIVGAKASRRFNGTRISCTGDFSAFSTSGGTRVHIEDLMIFSNSENTTYFGTDNPMLSFVGTAFVKLVNIHVNGTRDAIRRGIYIEDCDSFYSFDTQMVNFGTNSIILETQDAEVVWVLGNLEAYPNQRATVINNGSQVTYIATQTERCRVFFNCRRSGLSDMRAGANTGLILGPNSIGARVSSYNAAAECEVVLQHPFVSLDQVYSASMNVTYPLDFRGTSEGKANTASTVTVEPSKNYVVAALLSKLHTSDDHQPALQERDASNNVTNYAAWMPSVTLSAQAATYGKTPMEAVMFYVQTSASAEHLKYYGDHNVLLRAYEGLAGGRFLGSDGNISTTGWTLSGTSMTQVDPWHTSQNFTIPGVTISASAGSTAVTASTSVDALIVPGIRIYFDGEWRKVTARSGTSITLASGFTNAVVAENLVCAWPWAEVSQNTPSATYAIRKTVTTMKPNKQYAMFAHVHGISSSNSVTMCVGDARQGGNNQKWERVPMALPSQFDHSDIHAMADGSFIVGTTFAYDAYTVGNQISLGNISGFTLTPFKLAWFDVFEV